VDRLYIYGVGGHALVCADIANRCGYKDIEFIDDLNEKFKSFEDIKDNNSIPFFIAIGNNKVRKKIFFQLKNHGFNIINLIDPSAIVSSSVKMSNGILIMPNVVINAKAKIGEGVILNTSCIIEHENIIEDFVHISPNTALAGNVIVKENTHIGIGSTSIQGITIGKNCTIGAGSVMVKDIPDNVKAFGNPCRVMGKLNEK
jgi:UDP-N-acetylbacillosamine N-acetyltransferase